MEYATFAYLENYNVLLPCLLRQDLATQLGCAGHFIVLNYTNKVALIGIKGISHILDIFTDLVVNSVPQTLSQLPLFQESTGIVVHIHEGIWTTASTLADVHSGQLSNLVEQPLSWHRCIMFVESLSAIVHAPPTRQNGQQAGLVVPYGFCYSCHPQLWCVHCLCTILHIGLQQLRYHLSVIHLQLGNYESFHGGRPGQSKT